jgi:hypothetical protein
VKKTKQKTKKPKAVPKKSVKKKPTKKPAAKSEEIETMDRSALKTIVTHLKDAGSDIKVLKSDTDDALQKKVNDALQKLPAQDMLKKLESIVPEKLVSVLKRDCIGIFIDLSDVSCVRCPEAGLCAKTFINNLKGGLKGIDAALPSVKDVVEKSAKKTTITPVSRYEPERLVFVRDQPNPNPKGDPYHDTFQAVLDEDPSTLSDLREIVERDFEIENDGDFMKFVTTMRDVKEGIIKLDVDLSDKNKADLRAAGYDV